ncbi:multidrug efflux SMR transporter [Dongia soli]|uniref:Guanidinium exporter n=1 Tax=Dongia soli TaxID=600628 RepID=A0ABU5E5J0_9PROT|nr:multidrug efflux SMR transporter [Dongia soli]MDY0881441.1 multidrug efflux SMR transporter [Dongia soli]
MTVAWIMLVAAGLLDVLWAVSLKYAEGFSKPGWSLLSLLLLGGLVLLLGRSLLVLPVGTAYAVWTGIGAAGTVMIGIVLFGEGIDPMRLFWIGLIVMGTIGLKIGTA